MSRTLKARSFHRLGFFTLIVLYLLILAGGVVRATRSGMGCPDWPKCFGQYIPPLSEAELPANYQEIYADRGYSDTTFNVFHTWTEYINRLLGAFTGLLLFAMVVLAFWYYGKRKLSIALLMLFIFLLTGFQAWLGAIVVATILAPVKITTHMVVALIILALLIVVLFLAKKADGLITNKDTLESIGLLKPLSIIALLFTLLQVVFGTQVRQEVDVILKASADYMPGENWFEQLSGLFLVHRNMAFIIAAVNVLLWLKTPQNSILRNLSLYVVLLIAAEIVSGFVLAYFQLPAFFQPVHLLLVSLIFGVQIQLSCSCFLHPTKIMYSR
jgi:heme a synthase